MTDNRVIVSVLVKNQRGALMRVSNVFSRRGVNILQLTVAENTNPEISRITVLINDDGELDHKQIDKQLRKIEYVIDAVIMPYEKTISKELLLVKIRYENSSMKELQEKLFECSGKIISFDNNTLIGQIVASNGQINEFLQDMENFDIVEMSRSGVTALELQHTTFDNF
ncbi:MAG: acetolactate synthase small subunit [Clostridia bacterium]